MNFTPEVSGDIQLPPITFHDINLKEDSTDDGSAADIEDDQGEVKVQGKNRKLKKRRKKKVRRGHSQRTSG